MEKIRSNLPSCLPEQWLEPFQDERKLIKGTDDGLDKLADNMLMMQIYRPSLYTQVVHRGHVLKREKAVFHKQCRDRFCNRSKDLAQQTRGNPVAVGRPAKRRCIRLTTPPPAPTAVEHEGQPTDAPASAITPTTKAIRQEVMEYDADPFNGSLVARHSAEPPPLLTAHIAKIVHGDANYNNSADVRTISSMMIHNARSVDFVIASVNHLTHTKLWNYKPVTKQLLYTHIYSYISILSQYTNWMFISAQSSSFSHVESLATFFGWFIFSSRFHLCHVRIHTTQTHTNSKQPTV